MDVAGAAVAAVAVVTDLIPSTQTKQQATHTETNTHPLSWQENGFENTACRAHAHHMLLLSYYICMTHDIAMAG